MGTPIHEKPQVFIPSDGLHARLCGHAYCSVKLFVALRASKHTSRTVVDGQAASGEFVQVWSFVTRGGGLAGDERFDCP